MVDATLALPAETRLMVLAPVVRDRKGEFAELFEQMQAQGYVRFRVDGATVEAADVPKLKKAEKHDIDVVIDRVKVPAGRRRRRCRAAAPAPRRKLRGGAAHRRRPRHRARDGRRQTEHLFSSKFACPICSYSLPELEPRLFSFNSPVGACPTCDGLGVTTVFDAERVVAFPSLSLASGAVKGWDRRNAYTFSLLESVAGHYGFDLDTPFEELPRRGARGAAARLGRRRDRVRLPGRGRARQAARRQALASRSKASCRTSSGACARPTRRRCARSWRATRAPSPAPTATARGCAPRRGTCSWSTSPSGDKEPIFRVEHFTLREALAWFERLALAGAKAEIADKVIREIRSRLKFLNDVGLNYLSLDRSADSLSGGEAQRIRLASQIGSGLTGVMYVLDEPSIGLHQRDNERLIGTLCHLRDIGNSVLVVEHDEDAIRAADHVIDMGPGAGVHGGRVMAQGPPDEVAAAPESLTGRYLSRALRIPVPKRRVRPPAERRGCASSARAATT